MTQLKMTHLIHKPGYSGLINLVLSIKSFAVYLRRVVKMKSCFVDLQMLKPSKLYIFIIVLVGFRLLELLAVC